MAFNIDAGLIQNIREIGRYYAVEQIVLFGSRARGELEKIEKRLSD